MAQQAARKRQAKTRLKQALADPLVILGDAGRQLTAVQQRQDWMDALAQAQAQAQAQAAQAQQAQQAQAARAIGDPSLVRTCA